MNDVSGGTSIHWIIAVDHHPIALMQIIWDVEGLCCFVVQGNVGCLRIEHIADLVANQINDGLDIKLGCQPLLNAIDQCQFCRALFGLLEQALGFIEETRVFESNAHGVGEGFEQAHIRFTENIFAL
ncbi:MAG: hypothetical protein AKCLJLPJ_02608 [Fimbriimonadales bacterium]|nr:hypothetical protein [Fimbriimonadales bacterium]